MVYTELNMVGAGVAPILPSARCGVTASSMGKANCRLDKSSNKKIFEKIRASFRLLGAIFGRVF
jgi:hypothetical protein